MSIRQWLQSHITAIFVFHSILQNIKLKCTYNTYNNFWHFKIVILENLNCTFLGNLCNTFHKLFTFHWIKCHKSAEMFRCKSWDSFINKFFARCTDCITYWKNTRIKYTDYVSRISFINYLSVLSHNLLRSWKFHFLTTLYVIHILRCIKLSWTNSKESNSIVMCLVHISLNLKYKSWKWFFNRVN